MCYFTFQAPKGGLTWFLILGKIQNGGQNGDHCWCRHRPPAAPPPTKYTSSRWEDQRLSTKSKIVSKYILQHIKNCREGFLQPSPPPPTPLVPRWGYELRVRPRVRTAFIIYGWGLWGCFSLENILRVVPQGSNLYFTLACLQQKELSLTLSGYKEQLPRPPPSTA